MHLHKHSSRGASVCPEIYDVYTAYIVYTVIYSAQLLPSRVIHSWHETFLISSDGETMRFCFVEIETKRLRLTL